MAEELLFETTDETLATFTEFYRGKKKETKKNIQHDLRRTTSLLCC